MSRPKATTLALVATLALAGSSGFFIAVATGQGATAQTRTVTVNVGTGERGPAGPAGPQGPAGLQCPSGFEAGVLQLNAPGGQTRIWTCLEKP